MNPEEKKALFGVKLSLFLWGFLWCNTLYVALNADMRHNTPYIWLIAFVINAVAALDCGQTIKGLSFKK